MTSKLFANRDISAFYAKFRPKTPNEFISKIIAATLGHGAVADIGCGSGQCTALLANSYEKVYGFDVSADQIAAANQNSQLANVTYQVSPAEAIPLADRSLDAVTSAQAFHWFDKQKFFAEVDRLLKPGGALALITYEVPRVVYTPKDVLRSLVWDTYQHRHLMPHWTPHAKLVDEGYRSVVLPYADQSRYRHTVTHDRVSGNELLGYIKSWSGWHTLEAIERSKTDEIEREFIRKIEDVTDSAGMDEPIFSAEYEFHMIMANKPK